MNLISSTTEVESTITEEYTTEAVTLDAIQRAALRAKKLNMDRFHKLQRRPKNMALMPHINAAVNSEDTNLQTAELLVKSKVKKFLKIKKKILENGNYK